MYITRLQNVFSNVCRPIFKITKAKAPSQELRRNITGTKLCLQNLKNSEQWKDKQKRLRSTLYYVTTAGIVTVGLSYAAVPLYRIFCQTSGFGGTVQSEGDNSKVEGLQKVSNRLIKVRFNSDVSANMLWRFKPQQNEIQVVPGETVLAFYTATNPTDRPIIGVSTYNVIPFEAGQYFNKIQCFCFEEQQLNANEQVDMPVFFYIDPEFAEDPQMELVNEITLSYTFFEAREGMKLPIPSYLRK